MLTPLSSAVGGVVFLSIFMSRYLLPRIVQRLHAEGSKEILIMGSVALAFIMLMVRHPTFWPTNYFVFQIYIFCGLIEFIPEFAILRLIP